MIKPTTTQDHIQKEQTFLAYSFLPSPSAREITEVPPIPKMVPTAIKSKKTGVASETAATWYGSWVWPIKKGVGQVVNQPHQHGNHGGNRIFDDGSWN